MYNYKALVNRVVDGDTVSLEIDLGFSIYKKSNCRLWGINTPELRSKDKEEKEKAIMAKDYLTEILPIGLSVTIKSKNLDKYGRPLIEIFVNNMNINDEIVSKGFGVRCII